MSFWAALRRNKSEGKEVSRAKVLMSQGACVFPALSLIAVVKKALQTGGGGLGKASLGEEERKEWRKVGQ